MGKDHIKKFAQFVVHCFKKNHPEEVTKENSDRIKTELLFFANHTSLIRDILAIYRDKKFGGDINKPNSIIFYAIGITNKKADLKKEFNFLFDIDKEQSRISPPDIDMDLENRDPIINKLCHKYGKDRIAIIGTSMRFQPKAALMFSAKALDITGTAKDGDKRFTSENDQEATRISKILSNTNLPLKLKQWTGEDEKFIPPNNRLRETILRIKKEKERYPKVFESAEHLEGKIKSYGQHAAGIVLSQNPLYEDVPLHIAKISKSENFDVFFDTSSQNSYMTTQFDMEDLESLGLLKFDLLLVNNIRQMSFIESLVARSNGGIVPFDLERLETNDPKVFNLIDSGKLEGLFQISGKAFIDHDFHLKNSDGSPVIDEKTGKQKVKRSRGLMRTIGCSDFNDIVVANALGRPGPMAFDMHKQYAENKKDGNNIKYAHPILEPILKDTHGLMCLAKDTEIYDYKLNKIVQIGDSRIIDVQSQNKNQQEIILLNRKIIKQGIKDCVRVTFEDGSTIDCTEDHKLFTPKCETPASQVAGKLCCFSKTQLLNNKSKIHGENKARIAGMLVGNGAVFENDILFKSNEISVIDNLITLLQKEFPSCDYNKYDSDKKICLHISDHDETSNEIVYQYPTIIDYQKTRADKNYSKLIDFAIEIGIQNDKRIPLYIYSATEEEQCEFMTGFFDACGLFKIENIKTKNHESKVLLKFYFSHLDKCIAHGIKILLYAMGFESIMARNRIIYKENFVDLELMENQWFEYTVLNKYQSIILKSFKDKNKDIKYITTNEYYNSMSRGHLYNWKRAILVENIGQRQVYDILNCGDLRRFNLVNGLVVGNCYQEQMIKICMDMAGFTFAEADTVRKACGKKKMDLMDKIGPKFKEGCKGNSISDHVASTVWEEIKATGEYAFNKAHSVGYGLICYQGAWLKTYYTTEFICAVLTSGVNKDSERLEYLIDSFKKEYTKLEILPPDVCKSKSYFSPDGKMKIVSPLIVIKGIGDRVSEHIINNQPYCSIYDFIMKISTSIVDSKSMELLIENNCFQSLGDKDEIMKEYKKSLQMKSAVKSIKKKNNSMAGNLF
ncbi:MAG: hypothetical protein Q7R95_02035 [bacterium]|nr:hypothetical protein [bacterium]